MSAEEQEAIAPITSWQQLAQLQLFVLEKTVESAMHDHLIPEVFNQQGLEWTYEDPDERALRVREQDAEKSDTVIMFDMDEFKRINDTYKHEGGDLALQRVARGIIEVIQKQTRSGDLMGRIYGDDLDLITDSRSIEGSDETRTQGDILARIHGDEFVLVLLGTTQDEALKVAKRLVRHVREVGQSEEGVGETISMGVAEIPEGNLEEGIKLADIALYVAKEKGRDQAVAYNKRMQKVKAD